MFFQQGLTFFLRHKMIQKYRQLLDAVGGTFNVLTKVNFTQDYLSSEKSGSQAGKRVGSCL